MLRRSFLPFALGLLACRASGPDARSSDSPDNGKNRSAARDAEVEQPSHLMLPWGATLYSEPREGAIVLRLGSSEDPALSRPTVAVIGREGDWWKIATLDEDALEQLGGTTIAGFDVYALELWVPIGIGDPVRPIPPGPDTAAEPEAPAPPHDARAQALAEAAEFGMIGLLSSSMSNPPLQSGELRPPELDTDYRVSATSTVYWADGRVAGQVRSEHAFIERGETRTGDAGPLRCFAVRVGPPVGSAGQLCFAEANVLEAAVVPEAGFAWGTMDTDESDLSMWGDLEGGEIGDAYGLGGLGLNDEGGAYDGEGLGEIEMLGQGGTGSGYGGGGSGYGLGSGGFGSGPKVTAGDAKATGSMDADIGRRIVRAHANEVRECWSDAPSGSLELTLEIDADGKVTAAKARNAPDKTIRKCVEQAAGTWKFPTALAGSLSLTLSIEISSP